MTADGGAFCVRFGFFYERDSFIFFDFWTIFCCFLFFFSLLL